LHVVRLYSQKIFGEEYEEGGRRIHNIVSEPALQYGSATWVLREEDKRKIGALDMRLVAATVYISLRTKVRSSDTRKQLGTEQMVEEIEGSQRKWRNHVERMPPNVCEGKHIFITLLEDGTLDTQEEDEHNDSFSFRMDHGSILELPEEGGGGEVEVIKACVLNLLCGCFFLSGVELPDLGGRVVFPSQVGRSEKMKSEAYTGPPHEWTSLDPNTQQQLLNIIEQDTFTM
jgi:hypothetical protein